MSMTRRSLMPVLMFFCAAAGAQQGATTGLYDPQPPADSAYVRAVLASGSTAVDVLVDDKVRLKGVKPAQMSDYLVVPAGKHTITLVVGGKKLNHALDVAASRSMTVVFMSETAKPAVLEDKTNSNRLKAMLSAYHLDAKTGPVDVLTADGNTKVFSNIQPGQSAALAVNPVSAELIFAKAGDKAPLGKASVALSQGGAYSLVLSRADGSAAAVNLQSNKVERLSAK